MVLHTIFLKTGIFVCNQNQIIIMCKCFFILITLLSIHSIQAQLLATASVNRQPNNLYDGFDCDRVHDYIPIQAIPDRYPISVVNCAMPLPNLMVTSRFGSRSNRMHRGIDLKLEVGDTISVLFEGYVRKIGFDYGGYGRYMVVRHDNGLETVYGHLEKCLLKEGMPCKTGSPIALGGNTGRSTGPHLHLELLFMGKAIDPSHIIDFDTGKVHKNVWYFTKGRSKPQRKKRKGNSMHVHRVRKGETLASIAAKYEVSESALCSYNHLSGDHKLREGQVIRYN